MSSSIRETREEMDLLNRASITLDKTASGLIKSFATLSGENKKWTAASRLLSGTGLWSLQNRIRSVGAWLEIYFEGTKKAEQATNEYFDGLSELSDMLEQVGEARKNVIDTGEFQKMKKTLMLIHDETRAHELATVMIQKRYDSQYEALKDAAEREGKLLQKAMDRKERLEIKANKKDMLLQLEQHKKDIQMAEDYEKTLVKLKEQYANFVTDDVDKRGRKLGKRHKDAIAMRKQIEQLAPLAKERKETGEAAKKQAKEIEESLSKIGLGAFIKRQKAFVTSVNWIGKMKSGFSGLFKLSKLAGSYFMYIMLGILLLFPLFSIIREIFKNAEVMNTVVTALKEIFGAVFLVLSGFFDIFQAFFGGGTFGERLGTLLSGFMKIFGGLGAIIFSVGKGILKLAVGLVIGIITTQMKIIKGFFSWETWVSVYDKLKEKVFSKLGEWFSNLDIKSRLHGFFAGIINKLIDAVNAISPFKDIPHMAKGGIAKGGLTLVGERGPELVNLPKGARVHSNAESRRMGGNTINVNVSGRVGASDSELRDIAKKIGRMVNTEINRTTSSSTNVRY